MLSVLQAVQLLRRKQKLRAPLRKLLAIAHATNSNFIDIDILEKDGGVIG